MTIWLKYGDKGDKVKELQHLLNVNPYRKPRTLLKEDSVFGPLTAASIQGTKFWCGYTKEDIEPVAGAPLFEYLSGRAALPADNLVRRAARLKQVADNRGKPRDADKLRTKALTIIKGELGTLEQPHNSNHIKYNEWWGWGPVPYCVIGISWAWVKAGSVAFECGKRWAGTDNMLADAQAGRNGLHITDEPLPGTPGVIDFDGRSDPDHAITYLRDNGNGTVETIEFNTAKDSTYIEGVWRKDRLMRNCWWVEPEK